MFPDWTVSTWLQNMVQAIQVLNLESPLAVFVTLALVLFAFTYIFMRGR